MTTPPDATSNEVANESSNKFKEELAKIENEVGTNIGITQEIGSKGLRYPTDMADNQDVIKFSLIKYKVNDIKSGETFGRERIKPNAKVGNGDRLILGTVILPVPGQIQDTNRADWSDDSANAGQLAVGGLFGAAATGGDVEIASTGAGTIAADAVTNAKLANIAQGSIKVGGASNAPTDLDAKTDGQILVGDGTDINSVAISGDITLANDGTVAIAANAVALATDTTGDFVQNITGGTGITSTGSTSGEKIAHSLSVDAAQTGITSVKHNSLVIGGNTQNNTIDFGTDDVILFDTDNTERMRVDAGGGDVTGALTVSTNLTIDGNLVVNGDTTTLSTTNLAVFMLKFH